MILLMVVLLAGTGAFRIRLGSDPAQFYRPDPFLAAGERKMYELNQAAAARFVVVEGDSVQEALEREEAAGVKGLSAIIPSLKRQRENQALIAALREKMVNTTLRLPTYRIEDAGAGGQHRQGDHPARVFLPARMPVHLSSRAFSTESTLPRASSSGT
jgi:hypothetical protein